MNKMKAIWLMLFALIGWFLIINFNTKYGIVVLIVAIIGNGVTTLGLIDYFRMMRRTK